MITKTERLNCVCDRCGHKWTTRGERPPKVCPRCKKTDWNKGPWGQWLDYEYLFVSEPDDPIKIDGWMTISNWVIDERAKKLGKTFDEVVEEMIVEGKLRRVE